MFQTVVSIPTKISLSDDHRTSSQQIGTFEVNLYICTDDILKARQFLIKLHNDNQILSYIAINKLDIPTIHVESNTKLISNIYKLTYQDYSVEYVFANSIDEINIIYQVGSDKKLIDIDLWTESCMVIEL